jgi:hypothetical protein
MGMPLMVSFSPYMQEDISMTKDKWTHDELNELQAMFDNGLGWYDIAKVLGRTSDSVRMKWRSINGETGKSGKLSNPEYIAQNAPVIGLFDVETLPMSVYEWSLFDEHNGIEQVINGSSLLSWSGKFLNDSVTYSDILTPKEAKSRNDKRVTLSCYEFLKKCDMVCGHNVVDFDSRVAATHFLRHGLPPIKYIQIDTLKIARKEFRFDSNKLQFLNRTLGLREKIENEGFPLWRKCAEGDADALKRMNEYNIGDIAALEDLFYKFRPYIKNIQMALYSETDGTMCPTCGSLDLKVEGSYKTPAGNWDSYRCQSCTSLSRGKDNKLPKYKRKKLLVNS